MSNDQTPVYIDLYGTGRGGGDAPEEPMWKRAWEGRERLWIVFWVCGVFGMGVVIAGWLAVVFIGLQIGLLAAPQDTQGGFAGALTGITLGTLAGVPYLVWMTVSLWRCAPNCEVKLWGRLTRGWLIAQYLGLAMVLWNYWDDIFSWPGI